MANKFILYLVSFIGLACASSETEVSSNVNQDRIYQILSVHFEAAKNKIEWMASFTLGGPTGTTLELVDKSSVTINNKTMEKRTAGVSGTFYIREETIDFPTSAQTFKWIDGDGNSFVNSIVMTSVAFPENLADSFSKSSGFTIEWAGDELAQDNDWVSLEIKSLSNDDIAIKRINDKGAKSISISSSDLDDLDTGKIEMQLTRYASWIDLEQASSVGGRISFDYNSKKVTASLND